MLFSRITQMQQTQLNNHKQTQMDTIVFTLVQLQYEAYIQPPMLPNSLMKQSKEYYNLEQPKRKLKPHSSWNSFPLTLLLNPNREFHTPETTLSRTHNSLGLFPFGSLIFSQSISLINTRTTFYIYKAFYKKLTQKQNNRKITNLTNTPTAS